MDDASSRLIDYFAVYGLDEFSPVCLQSSNTKKSMEELISSKPYLDFNAISSIRLRIANENEVLKAKKTKFLYFFEIAVCNKKSLWLEVVYGRINGEERNNWNGRAICKLALYYLPSDGAYIRIPANYYLEPVPVLSGTSNTNQYSHTENDQHCYIGNYDTFEFLGDTQREGLKLVLTVCYCDTVMLTPINDIRFISAVPERAPNGQMKRVAKIPDGYSYINVAMGKNKDSFICFRNSQDPLTNIYEPKLIEKFPRIDHADSPLHNAIPMFCFSEGVQLSTEQHAPSVFSFILTTGEGSSLKVPRIYITALTFYEALHENVARQLHMQITASHKVYVPKAICLVSHWPFIDHFKDILKEIYRLHLSTYNVPIERVICNLLQEVPLPDQGVTIVEYTIGRQKLQFSRPPPQYLPLIPESCIEFLFRSLSVHDVITVWSIVMVEKKVLLISEHKALLTYVAMALTSLVFPFKWEQVLISILPIPLKNYIETIFPYIIGVNPSLLTRDIEIPTDAVRVDLDQGQLHFLEPPPKLPDKHYRTLYSRLMAYANIYTQHDPIRERVDDAFNSIMRDDEEFRRRFDFFRVRDAFLEFQTSLLKNYQRYLIFPEKAADRIQDCRSCFNSRGFLSYHKARTADNFLSKVSETSMFANFIESGFLSEVKYELQYFNEAMKFKRMKQDPSFVKPYFTHELMPALTVNDIGFEPGMCFRYDSFPRLNDELIEPPRTVKKLAVNSAPKPTLLLKDDLLMRMNEGTWAKFVMTSIYRIWFFMFTACMPKFKTMAEELMDLALVVMDILKKKVNKPDEEIYRRLIEACGHCELLDRVLSLFKRMKNQGIELDACTHGVYVKAVGERQELEKKIEQCSNLRDLKPESMCLSLDLDKCVYIAEDQCPNCGYSLMQEDIMVGWERSYSYYTTKCPQLHCEAKFVARFSVYTDYITISDRMNSLSVEFLSPPLLRKELENLVYTNGEAILLAKDLCDTHRILFWNMALYFSLLKLPTFFMNPNYNVENLPELIAEFKRPLKKKFFGVLGEGSRMDKSFTANSVDDISDTSSISGVSSSNLSHVADSKLVDFMRRGRSKKSSVTSDNQSTRSNTRNLSLLKLFAPLIEEFREENLKRGQITLAERGADFDNPEYSDEEP